jgi:hypothetical protein
MDGNEIDKAGGPAFPGCVPDSFKEAWAGMTVRDWFAGQYMATALERGRSMSATEYERLSGGRGGWSVEQIGAVLAYRYADAMLLARRSR